MKTVKQKLEEKLVKLEKQFPELVSNQMHLGTKDHPNYNAWLETSAKVGMLTLRKWRNLKYILSVWNSIDPTNLRKIYLEITSYLRGHDMSYYSRLLETELKQQREGN